MSILIFTLTYSLLYISQGSSMVISPCNVRNLVTQPVYGTSLKTKSLVNIIQIPPVFTQNVMVGICENRNQNISTGRAGEFYVCQQRYSAVEVYIADANSDSSQQLTGVGDKYNNIKFTRESVIIESGCDFTFNLSPFLQNSQGSTDKKAKGGNNIQQKMFLKSPYHSNVAGLRPQPSTSSSQSYGTSDSSTSSGNSPAYAQGRSEGVDVVEVEVDK